MLTRDDVQRCLTVCADRAGRSGVELSLSAEQSGLTRFAGNAITQNVSEESVHATVRLVRDHRTAEASTNRLDPDALRGAVDSAAAALSVQPPDRSLPPLPGRQTYRPLAAFDEQTALMSPMDRAHAVGSAVAIARRSGAALAGIITTGQSVSAIANTRGTLAFHPSTYAECTVMARHDEASGAARAVSRYVTECNPRRLAATAVFKASGSVRPATLDPGRYTVVLEPAAVSNLVAFLTYVGFTGRAFNEGRSFASGRIGERVFSQGISMIDDAWHPLTLGRPFDHEGMPRQPVRLVEHGVLRGVVHDRVTARRARTAPTGHAVPRGSIFGPMPQNLVVAPGSETLTELVSTTPRGVLVTEFHYSNLIEPKSVRITGMTRNGTFLIDRGRVRRGVRDMRYTEELVAALGRVAGIGRGLTYQLAFTGGGYVVPAMKIRDFHFTSGPDA